MENHGSSVTEMNYQWAQLHPALMSSNSNLLVIASLASTLFTFLRGTLSVTSKTVLGAESLWSVKRKKREEKE